MQAQHCLPEEENDMLKGKTVLLGVTGSIAAYKIAYLASALKKLHAQVHVLMTQNATNFINPITFETLTGNKCLVDTFDRNFQFSVEHVSIAKQADVVMIAPASANVIGKLAHGIADDMLTTTIMACKCKKIVSPAMNTNMYENPIVQDNLAILQHYGYEVIEPASGYLACGDTGAGKMPEPEMLLDYILREIAKEKDLLGRKVLVTAGPTQEAIDPVRYITNHSSGKMGFALAEECARRGAQVTLITGPVQLKTKHSRIRRVDVESAEEMYAASQIYFPDADAGILCAAVADYRPETVADKKIKREKEEELTLHLQATQDIAANLGALKGKNQLLVGFALETNNEQQNAEGKLERKNFDFIVLNSLNDAGAGFRHDTNKISIIDRKGRTDYPLKQKTEVAQDIIDRLVATLSPGF